MAKVLFLALSLTTTLISICVASEQLPEIAWNELSIGQSRGKDRLGEMFEAKWRGIDVSVTRLGSGNLRGDAKQEFARETQSLWRGRFKNVVQLLAVCKEDDHYAIVVELMRGGSLYDRLHNKSELLSGKDLWDIAIRIAQGLADLHRNGYIHRDLKSQSILFDEHGRARISDIGLRQLKMASATITQGHSCSSIRWNAPECFDDNPRITDRSDIYSYGMILWELLTGEIPFKHISKEHIVISKVHSGVREKIPETCHPLWREIIESCWEATPTRRPSAIKILDRLMASRPALPRSIWRPAEEVSENIQIGEYPRVPGTKTDWERVIEFYQKRPVPGYDIGSIQVIWDPAKNERFLATMKQLQQRSSDPRYVPKWKELPQADWRNTIHRLFSNIAVSYAEYEADDCPDVRLLPLWFGTQEHNLSGTLNAIQTKSSVTDERYFGEGIFTSPDAAFAESYANSGSPTHLDSGCLILIWGICYNCFPIIEEDYDQQRHQLKIIVPPQYDAKYIPVVQVRSGSTDYRPAGLCEPYHYRLFITQNPSQVLPRYVVRLIPSTGVESQIQQMYKVLLDDLQVLETTERSKLNDKLRAEYPVDPALIKIRAEEIATRQKIFEQTHIKFLPTLQGSNTKASFTLKQSYPLRTGEMVPIIAEGFEDVYLQFLKGKLFYKMNIRSNEEPIVYRISDLENPLFGTFDIVKSGVSAKYFQISTGFRTAYNPSNKGKVEIWIVPQFVLKKYLKAKIYYDFLQTCVDHRNKPFAVLFNWGGWQDLSWFEITGFTGNEFKSPIEAYQKRTSPAHVPKEALRSELIAHISTPKAVQRKSTATDGIVPEKPSTNSPVDTGDLLHVMRTFPLFKDIKD